MSAHRRAPFWRRTALASGFVLVVSGLGQLAPPALATEEPTAPDTPAGTAPDSPTVVPEFTTETTQVRAMPDGTFELTSNRQPVRTEQDGTWVDIDTTVERSTDGTVAPVASAADVTFSGGGSADPLVRLDADDSTMTVRWEGTLPRPVLEGDTATYRDIRAGVDLVLTAQASGYAQALVIRDAAAAQALITDPARISVAGTGLTFVKGADGNVVARDDDGPVFTGAPAVMWDSSTPGATTEEPDASNPADSKIRRVATSFSTDGSSMDMTLAPPASILSDSSISYPLFVDPIFDRGYGDYLTVHSKGWDYYNDANQQMRVGYCGWAECNTAIQGNARSYFNFNITALTPSGYDATVYGAAVRITQVHNATSAAQPVELHKATGFSGSTNWPGPIGADLETVSSNAGYGDNAAKSLTFDGDAVDNYLQAAATAEGNTLSFALAAPALDNKNYWKKFATNPTLTVRYGFAPTTPNDLTVANTITCSGQPTYASDTTPTLSATSDERSSSNLSLNYWFEVWRDPGTASEARVRYNPDAITKASEAVASWTTNSTNSNSTAALPSGNYGFRVRSVVNDPDTTNTSSAWSGWSRFTVDTTPPSVPVTNSFTYPKSYWGAAANAAGSFQITGSTDTAAFSYSIDGAVPPAPTNTTCSYSVTTTNKLAGYLPASGGQATIPIPANLLGYGGHTITVKAFNHAHAMSASNASYSFYVAPSVAGSPGTNRLEFESMTTSQPAGQAAIPANIANAMWSGGQFGAVITDHGSDANPTRVDYSFSVPVDGYYALGARLVTANHFGKVRFTVDDPDDLSGNSRLPIYTADGQTRLVVDTYSATTGFKYVPLGEYLPLNGVLLKARKANGEVKKYTFSVEVVGTSGVDNVYNGVYGGQTLTNYHDNGFTVGLDSLTVAPLRGADFTSLSAAFDNQGIGTTNGTRFDRSTAGSTSLSRDALTAAGIVPGSSYTLGDATFQIPSANGSNDNVTSGGQTITQPAGTRGSNIYLLATSTCGPVGGAGGQDLTIKYRLADAPPGQEYTTTDHPLSPVPDWLASPAPASPDLPWSVTLPHYLSGTTKVTTGTPTLYVLKFPIYPDYTTEEIASITLPRVGTTYTTAGCGAAGAGALHIFAMSVGS